MLDRERALAAIREIYDARQRGDKEGVARGFATGAHFEIAGDRALQGTLPMSAAHPMEAVSVLMDRFRFSDMKLLDAVVDGGDVAVRWELTVAVEGKPAVTTQLLDLVKLDEEGRIVSLIQFPDTALIRHLTS